MYATNLYAIYTGYWTIKLVYTYTFIPIQLKVDFKSMITDNHESSQVMGIPMAKVVAVLGQVGSSKNWNLWAGLGIGRFILPVRL